MGQKNFFFSASQPTHFTAARCGGWFKNSQVFVHQPTHFFLFTI
jgi:hypothetical protein